MKKALIIFVLLVTPVTAQELNASDRIAMQIGQLVIKVETQQDTINSLQRQVMQLQIEVKGLKDQYEPEREKK